MERRVAMMIRYQVRICSVTSAMLIAHEGTANSPIPTADQPQYERLPRGPARVAQGDVT